MTYTQAKRKLEEFEGIEDYEADIVVSTIYFDLKQFLDGKLEDSKVSYPEKCAYQEVKNFMFGGGSK